MIAHTIKNIVHCSNPFRLHALTRDIRALPPSDYLR
jgi:hypothetical protein